MGVLFLREQGCSWILKASLTLRWERSTQSCLIRLDFSEVHAAPTGWIILQSMARGIPHSGTGQTAAGSWDHCSATWWDKLDLDSPDTVLSCVPGAAQRTISNFTAYLFSPLDLELEFLMSNISISDKLLNKKRCPERELWPIQLFEYLLCARLQYQKVETSHWNAKALWLHSGTLLDDGNCMFQGFQIFNEMGLGVLNLLSFLKQKHHFHSYIARGPASLWPI